MCRLNEPYARAKLHALGSSHHYISHRDETNGPPASEDSMPSTGCHGRVGYPHHRGMVGGSDRGVASNDHPPIQMSTRWKRGRGEGGGAISRRVFVRRGVTSRAWVGLACGRHRQQSQPSQAKLVAKSTALQFRPKTRSNQCSNSSVDKHAHTHAHTHTPTHKTPTTIIFTVPVRG